MCDARTKEFLVSDAVEEVIRRGKVSTLFVKPYRPIPTSRRYWRYMQQKMCGPYGAPARIMRLPKGLNDLTQKSGP
jgi:hypothetical protein